LIVTHAFPIESFRRGFRIWIMLEHFRISAFCVRPVFAHESNTREGQFQLRAKLVLRQVTLDAKSLFAVRIENQYARCPESVETMEVNRMLFDVCFERHKVVVDE